LFGENFYFGEFAINVKDTSAIWWFFLVGLLVLIFGDRTYFCLISYH